MPNVKTQDRTLPKLRTKVPKTSLTGLPSGPATQTEMLVAEFFAGIGLVRMGLEGAGFTVPWSNDIAAAKHSMYVNHFRDSKQQHDYILGDIAAVTGRDLPQNLSLAWASFPCTDLSLAGKREGLIGKESATFWHFTRLLEELGGQRPPVVALENVVGFATSHSGSDLVAAVQELNRLGYSVDVLTIDARRFVPQSRPRLFLIGAQNPPADADEDEDTLRPRKLDWVFNHPDLRTHRMPLAEPPVVLQDGLSSIIEELDSEDERWWNQSRTKSFMDSLSPTQMQRVEGLRAERNVTFRTAYRRTRQGVATWEIRSDEIAGCLRTARGGSSKQALVRIDGNGVKVRWMTTLEYARLMGAGNYTIEGLQSNQALFGFGDAVCVPVVTWLAENYLKPLIRSHHISSTSECLDAACG